MAVEAVLDHEQSTSPGTPTTGGLAQRGMGLDDSVIANSSVFDGATEACLRRHFYHGHCRLALGSFL